MKLYFYTVFLAAIGLLLYVGERFLFFSNYPLFIVIFALVTLVITVSAILTGAAPKVFTNHYEGDKSDE